MNVSLTPKLEEIVRRKVASGLYNNASEVIREALRLLVERDGAGDAKFDARQLALLDKRAGSPAASVDDLLVGEHGLVDRVPVDVRLLAFD